MKSVAAICCCAAATATTSSELHPTIGQIYQYDFASEVNATTRDATTLAVSNGTSSEVVGTLLVKPISSNGTHYEFVMNMFDTTIGYEHQAVASPGLCTAPCPGFDDDVSGMCCGSLALGYDVYYTQAVTGEVGEVSVSADDSEYFVQIKLGAINAFHTLLQPASTAGYTSTETDVTGVHSTAFTAVDGGVSKSFTQTDMLEFSDSTLQQHNVHLESTGEAFVHPSAGYIHRASVSQSATLVDIRSSTDGATAGAAADSAPRAAAGGVDMSGFNAQVHSAGRVDITAKATAKYLGATAIAGHLLDSASPQHHPAPSLFHAARASMGRLQIKANRAAAAELAAANEAASAQVAPVAAGHGVAKTAALRGAINRGVAAAAPLAAAPPAPAPGADPFNRTWAEAKKWGGSVVGADFAATAFAGTNLGACNAPTFNYDAQAATHADVTVFGKTWTAFSAYVQYGKDGGSALADEVVLDVFGKRVYQQAIPAAGVDCSEHTYQMAHSAPGAAVKHTLWVGPIPVTMSATVNLELNVEWGWHMCDTDLSADVYIKPAATVSVTGAAELNLLVLDAATSLEFAANTALQPDLSVSGTKCDVGFEVDLVRSPADSAALKSSYSKRKCKHLFFDCKMEQAGEKTWWSWQEDGARKVLANETWPIKL
jgi:hypothetical protein